MDLEYYTIIMTDQSMKGNFKMTKKMELEECGMVMALFSRGNLKQTREMGLEYKFLEMGSFMMDSGQMILKMEKD